MAVHATEQLDPEAREALRPLLAAARDTGAVELRVAGGGVAVVPEPVLELLREILVRLANGTALAVLPVHSELSTQKAADLLDVSRPHLVSLLDAGKIPHRKVGTHRRASLCPQPCRRPRPMRTSRPYPTPGR